MNLKKVIVKIAWPLPFARSGFVGVFLVVRWELGKHETLFRVLLRLMPRYLQVSMRVDNEVYLRNHPEVALLLSSFVETVMTTKPEDVTAFAAEFFTSPTLASKITTK